MTTPSSALPGTEQRPCEVCQGHGRTRATGPPCVHCEGTGTEPWSLEPLPPLNPAQADPVLRRLRHLGADRKAWQNSKVKGAEGKREQIRRAIREQVFLGESARLTRQEMADAVGISRQALYNNIMNNPTGRRRA